MKKGTMKLLAQILVVAMITALLPTGLIVSAATGNITNLTINPARPGTKAIRVATPLSANGNMSYTDRTTMTTAHMGAKIKGKTQILTPVDDSNRLTAPVSSANPTPTPNYAMQAFLYSNQEYFNFTPDQPGAVIVLSNINLHSQSDLTKFKNNYASWTCVANNIYAATPPGYPPSPAPDWELVPSTYEPANAPYYMTKYQWTSEALALGQVQTNADINGVVKYPYAYKKYFLANTPVSIPVIGTYSTNENLMVFVDWDDVETEDAKLSTFTYTPNGDVAATVTGFTPTDEGGTYNVLLPLGTTSVTMNSKTVASLASVSKNPDNNIVDVSSGSGTYIMTVQYGTHVNIYTVNFTVSDKSANAKLSSLTYTADNGAPAAVTGFLPTDNGGTYTIALPEGAHKVSIEGVVADTGKATISYNKDILDTFAGSIVATVTAEDGTIRTYTVCFDVPGYIINDEFDRHGDVGALVQNKRGAWTYAASAANEFVAVGIDPKDPTNKVAKFATDYSVSKWPAIKTDAQFTKTTVGSDTIWSPLVVSGETLLNKKSGPESYIEFRYKNGANTTSIGRMLTFSNSGSVTFAGADTGYRWTPNEWIQYSVTIVPNPANIKETTVMVSASGGITDKDGNPAVMSGTYTVDMTKVDYLTTGYINVIYNTSIPMAGADSVVYGDNFKIYTPAAGEITIPDNTNIGVNGGVEVVLNKYEFDPNTMIPENIVVTTDSGATSVDVWNVGYDPLCPDKFKLYFNNSLADNKTYTVSLNGGVKDVAGNSLTGTATFTTKAADPITGISISSTDNLNQAYGATEEVLFTANTTPDDNVNTNNIVWSVNGAPVGIGKYFAFNPDAIGSFVVSASVVGNPALTVDPITVTVVKGTQSAPAAIEVAKTHNSITITPVEGAEYGVKLKSSTDEVVYGTSNVFTGLAPETEYTAYIRMAGSELYDPSSALSADVTTDAAPMLYGDVDNDGNFTISDVISAAEIAIGSAGYAPDQVIRANVSDKVDMTVDISDVVMIAEHVLDPTTTFPVDRP